MSDKVIIIKYGWRTYEGNEWLVESVSQYFTGDIMDLLAFYKNKTEPEAKRLSATWDSDGYDKNELSFFAEFEEFCK